MSRYYLRSTTLSVTYSIGQLVLGLLIHPFQTTQLIVKEKYWTWLIFTPAFLLLIAFIIWQSIWLLLFNIFSLAPTSLYPFFGFALQLIKWWFTYFCLIWQIVVWLLFIKFYIFFASTNKLE